MILRRVSSTATADEAREIRIDVANAPKGCAKIKVGISDFGWGKNKGITCKPQQPRADPDIIECEAHL